MRPRFIASTPRIIIAFIVEIVMIAYIFIKYQFHAPWFWLILLLLAIMIFDIGVLISRGVFKGRASSL